MGLAWEAAPNPLESDLQSLAEARGREGRSRGSVAVISQHKGREDIMEEPPRTRWARE